jgi:hypothetical protein
VAKGLRQRFKLPPTRSSRHLVDRVCGDHAALGLVPYPRQVALRRQKFSETAALCLCSRTVSTEDPLQLAAALDADGRSDEARPLWEKMLTLAESSGDQQTAAPARAKLSQPPVATEETLMRVGLDALYQRTTPPALLRSSSGSSPRTRRTTAPPSNSPPRSTRVQALTSTWRQPRPTEISADLRHVGAGCLRRGPRVVRHQERRVGDAYHFPAARTLRGQRAAADSLEIGKRGGAMGTRGKSGTGHGISFQRTRAPLRVRLVLFAAARSAGGLATGEAFRGGDGGGGGGSRSRLADVVQPSSPPFRARTR